jgi:hypothetical protein
MPLIPLKLPPGVYRNGTDFDSSNRWRDANLVRWTDGSLRPVGGWREVTFGGSIDSEGTVNLGTSISAIFANDSTSSSTNYGLDASPRGIHAWVDNNGVTNLVGANFNKLVFITPSGLTTDITPGTCEVDGTLDSSLTTKATCIAATDGVWTQSITDGDIQANVNTSYGGYYFGGGTYGNERPDSGVYQEATTWSIDNWGQNLIACSSKDKKIYEWGLSTTDGPTAITDGTSAIVCSSIIATEERFLFALAEGNNPRKVRWCDRENNTVWTPLATNEAGDFELQTSGQIMCGVRMRGRTIILTDNDAHIATYSGPPFVYGFERVGTACGIVSRKALVAIDEGAFWMGRRGFFMFNGSVATEVQCDVVDYVFDNMNKSQVSKVTAVHNSQYGEVWWFYPSDGEENDSYVSFDYKEGHWNIGKIKRTTGIDSGVYKTPMWFDETGKLFQHEIGSQMDDNEPFAETGPISLGNGDTVAKVTSIIPDEKTQGDVQVDFKTRFYPNGAETSHGPYDLSNPTSVRFTGRQLRMRIIGNKTVNWRAGTMRVEAKPGGKR